MPVCDTLMIVITQAISQALTHLVCRLARSEPIEPDAPWLFDLRDSSVQDLIRRHFLAPLAYRAGMQQFRGDYVANALMAELRVRTLAEVRQSFAQAGIPIILLKGISYAEFLYDDAAERPMSDIDLLVPPADHCQAAHILRRLGYWWAGAPRQLSPWNHAVAFKRKGASIDLHRSIMQPLRSRIDIAAIWHRAKPMRAVHGNADGSTTSVTGDVRHLDFVDEAVLHLAHIARHELMVPLVNYVDAIRLLSRVDRAEVKQRAQSFRLGRAIGATMNIVSALADDVSDHGGRALLPSVAEICALRPVPRRLQLMRKALLVDGAPELLGLMAVGARGHFAHRLRRWLTY